MSSRNGTRPGPPDASDRVRYDVAVIGGGIVGCAYALAAARRGLRVGLFERHDEPRSASTQNFGMVIPFAVPDGVWPAYGLTSLSIWRGFANRGVIETGSASLLVVASNEIEEAICHEFVTHERAEPHGCSVVSSQRAAAFAPGLRSDPVRCALEVREVLRVEPRSACKRLLGYLQEQFGVQVFRGTAITGMRSRSDHVSMTTSRGEVVEASDVFLCSGNELRLLRPDLFPSGELEHVALRMMRLRSTPRVPPGSMLAFGPTMRRYPNFVGLPSHDALLETPNEPGFDENDIHVLVAHDTQGRVVLGDSHHRWPHGQPPPQRDAAVIDAQILGFAEERLDLTRDLVEERWEGVYLECEAGLWNPSDGPVHVVTGIGGKGMTCAFGLAEAEFSRWTDKQPSPLC